MLLPATPGWASLPVVVCSSPPLLAGACWRRWCVVCGVWCVVCGVRRWCVGGVVAGVWCGWSLATPGGGSCVLLPATPGWVSLPVVVGGPRHSWLRVPGAVPRHSWLGSVSGGVWRGRSLATPGGGSCVLLPATPGWVSVPVVLCGPPPLLAGVCWRRWCVVCGVWCVVCGVWCVVCGGGVLVGLRLVCGVVGSSPLPAEVPVCYSPPPLAGFRCRRWWAFLATPGGGSRARFPATPGWVLLSAAVCGVWCLVCGVWRAAVACVVGLWLVCGVVGPSPLLAEVPVCYSPPLLAGFRCLWWCAVPRHSWLGFRCRQWRVVCGVWCVVSAERRWCVGGVVAGVWCGWSLATPGGGSRVLLPATPGWVSLPVVVGGPRHSWLRSQGGGGVWWGCGWCVVWLVPRHSWRRFLCATPRHSWLGFAACGGVRFPATPGWGSGAGSGVWCVVCGVWCAVSGGGVLVGLWLVCDVVGPSPLLAEVPVCYSPPHLVGFRCRWWWAVLATLD